MSKLPYCIYRVKDHEIIKFTTDRALNIIFLFLIFLLAFIFAFNKISEADTFWHLKLGQYILNTHSLPYKDIFSYTLAGTRSYPVEWLFEVVWFFIYNHTGAAGLVITKATIAGFTAALLYLSIINYRVNRYISFAVISGIFITAGFYFQDRPQLITYLCMSLFIFIISLHDKGRRRSIWALPFIMLAWVNMHPGAVFGLIFLAGWLLEVTVKFFKKDKRAQEYIKQLSVFILACIASFLTPSTYHLYTFLFQHVTSLGLKTGLQYINEFKAPSYTVNPALFIGLIVCSLIFMTGIKKIPLRYIVFGIIAFPAAYTMERMVIMALIGSAPAIGIIIDHFISPLKRYSRFAPPLYIIITVVPFFFIINQYRTDFAERKGVGIERALYPDKAIDFILRNKIKGNIYNEINLGGQLIFLGYPEIRDFIDTRLNPERTLLPEVFTAMNSAQAFQGLMDKYNVTYALVSNLNPVNYSELFTSPDWALVYFDDYARIYVKTGTGNDKLIGEYAYHVFDPSTFLSYDPFLSPKTYFTKPGLFTDTERLVQEAPDSAMAHLAYGLSMIYNNSDYADGLAQIAIARRIMPYNPVILLWSGIEHGLLKDDLRTMKQRFDMAGKILNHEGKTLYRNIILHYIMGYYYSAAGLKKEAVKSLKFDVKISPDFYPARELLDRIR